MSDPEIDNLLNVVWDMEQFFNDSVGISRQVTWQVSGPITGAIRAWSKSSADQKNRNSPLATKGKLPEKE